MGTHTEVAVNCHTRRQLSLNTCMFGSSQNHTADCWPVYYSISGVSLGSLAFKILPYTLVTIWKWNWKQNRTLLCKCSLETWVLCLASSLPFTEMLDVLVWEKKKILAFYCFIDENYQLLIVHLNRMKKIVTWKNTNMSLCSLFKNAC